MGALATFLAVCTIWLCVGMPCTTLKFVTYVCRARNYSTGILIYGYDLPQVTSLYRDHNLALVDVLRSYVEEGRPLEAAFSRARSFSRKFKRTGRFVPRGLTRQEYDEVQGVAAGGGDDLASGAQIGEQSGADEAQQEAGSLRK